MKKKLLFVIPNLECGGAQKSLITLLNCLDNKRFEIDLYVFEPGGMFLKDVPKEINILEVPKYWGILNTNFFKSMKNLFIKRKFNLIIPRIVQGILSNSCRNTERLEQLLWRFINSALEISSMEYDIAIGYLERNPIYFIIDRVKAKSRIGWIHTNYSNLSLNTKFEEQYFDKLDYLITVSNECANTLKTCFQRQAHKILVIENIILPSLIKRLSYEIEIQKPYDVISIVTVARLAEPKGVDLALEACHMLLGDNYKIIWSVLGDGPKRTELEYKIKLLNMESTFFLVGAKSNPYPYISHCDIYVQPSRIEGKCIAVEEAKILGKPIVVTNYDTAIDQITDGVNGIIVQMDPISIYRGIKNLIDNFEHRVLLKENLLNNHYNAENEINKLYKVLEGKI